MSLIAKILHTFGLLPTNVTVDTGVKIRVTLELRDQVTASPIADADVAIEQSAKGKNAPVLIPLGRTDSEGTIDRATRIGWTYPWHEWRMNPDAAEPPFLCVTIRKVGFPELRVPFLIDTLSQIEETFQLTLGTRSLSRPGSPT